MLLAFTISHVSTLIEISTSSDGFEWLSWRPFPLQGSLEHFSQGRSSGNKAQLLFIWECLNPSLFWRTVLTIQHSWLFFNFSTLNVSIHGLLASKVSDEKSADIIGHAHKISACNESILSCFQDPVFQNFDYNVSWHEPLSWSWSLLSLMSFILGFRPMFSFKYSLCPPPSRFETPAMCMLALFMVSYRSLRLCSFFFLVLFVLSILQTQ